MTDTLIDKEKFVLSAMFIREGECIPAVAAALNPDDFYRPAHRITYNAILKIYGEGKPTNILSLIDELKNNNQLDSVGITFAYSLMECAHTTAYVNTYVRDIKEAANLRRIRFIGEKIAQEAQKGSLPLADIVSYATTHFNAITGATDASTVSIFGEYFNNRIISALDDSSKYGNRKTNFDNIDTAQFFSPGLYVLGATPACGKTTFAWQLLEQLARNGEHCIFCSYEMSALELYCKSVAREILNRHPDEDPLTLLSAAKIRRCHSSTLPRDVLDIMSDFASSTLPLKVIELRNENVDSLLNLLRPLCVGVDKAPIVCVDYLQIIPHDKDAIKLGVDDTVRKLKAFQRDTNTTFIVVSSFNRANYLLPVSFESFKESGGIEYTADVVWGLQLNIMNKINSSMAQTKARKMVEDAKKEIPREIQLKCLKNRQGANYDCFFRYFAANDCFVPCDGFDDDTPSGSRKSASDDEDDKD